MRPLRICIDCRFPSGTGGIEQVVIGLASAFGELEDGHEEYWFLTRRDEGGWLSPFMTGACRPLYTTSPSLLGRSSRLRAAARRYAPFLRATWSRLPALPRTVPTVSPLSDGVVEKAGIDVVHFPASAGFRTGLPNVFQPHDLLHLHYPEMLSPRERRARELRYRAFCAQASFVVMMTSWGKRDLICKYGLSPEKVGVVPGSSVLDAYPDPGPGELRAAQESLRLPERFIFYPAHMWPNKNHIGLLEALAQLRNGGGPTVSLVLSGEKKRSFPEIARAVRRLGLVEQVRFVGFVSPGDLRCLYELALAVVFPSRFEGWGLPLVEAFSAGTPLACSTATGLPDIAGDAALLFDPDSTEEIADAVRRLWTEADLRSSLIERGSERADLFSFERTARLFRAHYRRLAGRALTGDDEGLLAAPPLA